MSTRRQRAQLAQQQQRRAQRSRYVYIGAGVAGIVILIALAVMASGVLNPATPPAPAVASGGTVACSNVQSFPTQNNTHIKPNEPHPPYSTNPPTSGWHWENEQEWGIYTTPQIQEQLVHNLEHGGIVIQYNNLTPNEITQLTQLVSRDDYHMILAPYPGLTEAKIALTAWNRLQYCQGVDEPSIRAFVNAFRDKGPERVP